MRTEKEYEKEVKQERKMCYNNIIFLSSSFPRTSSFINRVAHPRWTILI